MKAPAPHPLPRPTPETNKHRRGHVLALCGGLPMAGAIRLSAKAAVRVGAGRVTVAVQAEAAALVGADCAALMLSLIDEPGDWESLLETGDHSVLLLGPGLPVADQTRARVLAGLAGPKHVVLDAGALSAFENDRASLFEAFKRRHELGYSLPVLTPHAGEFRRLFDSDIGPESVSTEDKRRLSQQAAAKAHAVIVAKGHNSVLASPKLVEAKLLPPGSPWLATSGTGDVLAGLIAGLLAQGLSPEEAAETGAWVHSEASYRAGPGLIADDLDDAIRAVLVDHHSKA